MHTHYISCLHVCKTDVITYLLTYFSSVSFLVKFKFCVSRHKVKVRGIRLVDSDKLPSAFCPLRMSTSSVEVSEKW